MSRITVSAWASRTDTTWVEFNETFATAVFHILDDGTLKVTELQEDRVVLYAPGVWKRLVEE